MPAPTKRKRRGPKPRRCMISFNPEPITSLSKASAMTSIPSLLAPCNSTATKLIAGLVVAPPPQRSKPSSVTIEPIAAEQIKQSVEHLYRLGVRPVFEAFCAIYGGADVLDTLQAYRRLDPAVVHYLGADRLPRRRYRGRRHEN